jgi:hypothetical protein
VKNADGLSWTMSTIGRLGGRWKVRLGSSGPPWERVFAFGGKTGTERGDDNGCLVIV